MSDEWFDSKEHLEEGGTVAAGRLEIETMSEHKDKIREVAEEIFFSMMSHWFALPEGESVLADVLIDRITAILGARAIL